jgi:hypothetical protein
MKAKNSGSRPGFLLLILFLLPLGVFSQELDFAPFVTELEIEAKNNLIRLTWKDSPDAQGPVYIYRSDTPFDTAQPGFGKPEPVEVPYGVEYYIDEVESTGTLYYFVAASDEDGLYEILLPVGNSALVTISDLPFSESPSLLTDTAPEGAEGDIYALETTVEGDGVFISYLVNIADRNTVLYRSVQPITRTTDLLRAVIVQSGLSSSFTDYPVPGIPYYYAVIFEDELTMGSVGIYPGYNATIRAVEVKAANDRVGLPGAKAELRSMPLPLMALNYAVPGLAGMAEAPSQPLPLSLSTRRALENFRSASPPPYPLKKSRAFSQDLETEPTGGEEQGLRAIVQGRFIRGDWEASIAELRRYLSLHHSESAGLRARFYLAQSLYFSRSYREALLEFLMVKDYFPVEANEWIRASLAALIK